MIQTINTNNVLLSILGDDRLAYLFSTKLSTTSKRLSSLASFKLRINRSWWRIVWV